MKEPIDALTRLVDLPGFEVFGMTLWGEEWWLDIRLASAQGVVACKECGVVAEVKDYDDVIVRDLGAFGRQVAVVWRKKRYRCAEPSCPAGSWSETSAEIEPGKVATERVRREMCRRVGEDMTPVSQVAEDFGVAWHTVDDAVQDYGRPLVDDPARLEGVTALGVDETLFMTATPRTPTRYVRGFADVTPGRKPRLGDVVDGRDGDCVQHWLDDRPGAWLDDVTVCASDAARCYVNGLVAGGLGHATFVLDHFHVSKLANECVDDVRRRVQREQTGHRGRRDDPLYKTRKILLMRYARLPPEAEARLGAACAAGDPYGEVAAAWVAMQLLHGVYAAPDEHTAHKHLFEFYTWCADIDVGEVTSLAATSASGRTRSSTTGRPAAPRTAPPKR